MEQEPGIFEEPSLFVSVHGACGGLTGDAEPPTRAGYRLWIVCSCGAGFKRVVTPERAGYDLVHSTLPVLPN